MNRADETAAKIETAERQSVGAAAGSDDKLKDFPGASHQSRPALHNLLLRITHHLDYDHSERNVIDYRLRAIESQMKAIGSQTKRRASRAFVPYLVAICVGVAGTLAWQSYGEEAKQTIATRAPELGWSPEVRQMIANWTKPLAGPENIAGRPAASETRQAAPVANTAPETVAPSAPTVPSFDPEQVHQIVVDLTALRQTVEQIAAGQDQMARKVDRLQAADQEILVKISESPPPPPIAAAPAVAGQPAPVGSAPSQDTQNTALRASCGPDVQRLCPGISSENGGVIKCLNSHRMALSPICDTYFKEIPGHRAAQKGAPKATSSNPVTPPPSRAPMPPPHP